MRTAVEPGGDGLHAPGESPKDQGDMTYPFTAESMARVREVLRGLRHDINLEIERSTVAQKKRRRVDLKCDG